MKNARLLKIAISVLSLIVIFATLHTSTLQAASKKPSKPAAKATISGEQLLTKIFDTFHKQRINSMTYDETRTVSTTRNIRGYRHGSMQLDEQNSSTYVMRYFYQAPDKHGYRMLSEQIDGFWPGSPKQENAVNMDERWLENIKETYTVVTSPLTKIRGKDCYVLNLVPRPGKKYTFPMTWYIDRKANTIIKFIHLLRKEDGTTISTTGNIEYGKVKGRLVPLSADWKTTASNVPLLFEYTITYDNYMFNVPLDKSVFRVQPLPPPAEQ